MKKIFLLGILGVAILGVPVSAEEPIIDETPIIEEEEPVIEEKPCKVIVNEAVYGDVIVDIEEGEIGDVVTIYAKPYPLCAIDGIFVNGNMILPNEDGNYTFLLIEGENVISPKFVISQEQIAKFAEVIAKAKEGDWDDIFSIKNLFTIIGWFITLLSASAFGITLLKYKNAKTISANDTLNVAKNAIDENLYKAIKEFLTTTFGPTFEKLDGHIVSIEEVCKTLTRCFILSQEDTPEARLAIIQEMTKLQQSDENLTAQVRAIINNEIEKNKKAQKEKEQVIQELKEANESIVIEENTVEEETVIPTE